MIDEIILASKSGVRKKILNQNGIKCKVIPANIDEDGVKESLLQDKATPEIISKNLAELKANKISKKKNDYLVLGADSVIDLSGELISKPINNAFSFNSKASVRPPVLSNFIFITSYLPRHLSKDFLS